MTTISNLLFIFGFFQQKSVEGCYGNALALKLT